MNKKGNQTGNQVPSQPFLPVHDSIYNDLRTVLTHLMQQGVPGIDQLLHTLNSQHVNYQAGQAAQGAMGQAGTSAYGQAVGQDAMLGAMGPQVGQAFSQPQPGPSVPAPFQSPPNFSQATPEAGNMMRRGQ